MNDLDIRKTFDVFKGENGLMEVRIINGSQTWSGYFKDVDNLIEKLKPFDLVNTCNVYFVLNAIEEACYDRSQSEHFEQRPKQTTNDNDIVGRDWLLIDIDPSRTSGVSASDEEKENARKIALTVYEFLKSVGFSKPVSCDSGNGWHLLYKIALENSEENKELVKNFLGALDIMFSNEYASIDTSVFNASRITKLYGTIARKGNNSKKRPHRQSKICRVPDKIEVTRKALLQKVVDMLPKEEAPTYKNNYNKDKESFDLEEFISKHNIRVQKIVPCSIGRKFVLEECVFDCNHKAPDACIFELNNGCIGYKCFHNSCQKYTWRDVREKFEPNAYKKKEIYPEKRTTRPTGTTISELFGNQEEKDKSKAFLMMSEIQAKDRSEIISIPSGFQNLDSKIIGFNKGEISLWSGKNGSGKSSLLTQICINACDQGFRCAMVSGEMTKQRMKQWIEGMAAGRQNMRPSQYNNLYYTPKDISENIDKWLDDKLWLYDNDFGNKFEDVLSFLKDICERRNIDMIVLDNLMALDIFSLNGDKYQQQTIMILALTEFVKKYNVHLHIVCHPRKAVGFLRKDDISGTADLTNAVDNVFIVHRVGNDFIRLAKEFYGEIQARDYYGYDNVAECCKNRDLGVMDELFGFYFDIPSKRFKIDKFDNKVYGWEKPVTRFMAEENLTYVDFDELPFPDEEDGDLPY